AMDGLVDAGSRLAEAARNSAGSRTDYLRELSRIQNALVDVEKASSSVGAEAQDEYDALAAQAESLGLINESVLSLPEAFANLIAAQNDSDAITARAESQLALMREQADALGLLSQDAQTFADAAAVWADMSVTGQASLDAAQSQLQALQDQAAVLGLIGTNTQAMPGTLDALHQLQLQASEQAAASLEALAALAAQGDAGAGIFEGIAGDTATLPELLAALADLHTTSVEDMTLAQSQLDALHAQFDATGIVSETVVSLTDAIGAYTETSDRVLADQIAWLADMLSADLDALNPEGVMATLVKGFSRLDKDGNGLLNFDELSSALKGKATDEQISAMTTILDTNLDGMISHAEAVAASYQSQSSLLQQAFNNLARVTGGAVDAAKASAELLAAATRSAIEAAFDRLDWNRDGAVSADESDFGLMQQVRQVYNDVLGRDADPDGLRFWEGRLREGTSLYDLYDDIARAGLGVDADRKSAEEWLRSQGVPGFASGGLHSGGLRLVGERGPELEVTGPARIYSAGQTASMLGGGGADTAQAISRLERTVARQGDALRAIAKHTMQTAKRTEYLERWDFDGMPGVRT
ncbi:MAG: DUF4214 domain-containing protein, partial [Gammaproteobacteria bacterium]|nr:DUF4214 domain-containing protein [Gammaproteobacteria bacterium]